MFQSENNWCKSVIQEHLECSGENIQTSSDISQLPKLNHEYYLYIHTYICVCVCQLLEFYLRLQ